MSDPIQLYLDEDTLSRALVKALTARSVDVLTSKEAKLIQIPDERHLQYATELHRTVLTFNVRDFPLASRIHVNRQASCGHHCLRPVAGGCDCAPPAQVAGLAVCH